MRTINKSNFSAKKVWNTNKSPKTTLGVGGSNTKTFATDKDKIQKIFAPTIQDNPDQKINTKVSNWFLTTKEKYYDKEWFRKINQKLINFQPQKHGNYALCSLICLSVLGFFVYLAFFDQYFIIRQYNIKFLDNSYLNQKQNIDLVNYFNKNKLYGLFPNNQYWFINNMNLTTSAQQLFPSVESVEIERKSWPNSIDLNIKTKKPLLTLSVKENNEQKYWQIAKDGTILSQDKAGIWYNLVTVEKPYNLAVQTTGNLSQKFTLQDYDFSKNDIQLKRFLQTNQLFDYLKTIDLKPLTITYPSLSDTDIIIQTEAGTNLMFDASEFNFEVQKKRIAEFFGTAIDKHKLLDLEHKGNFKYVDFRITRKIHFCQKDTKC